MENNTDIITVKVYDSQKQIRDAEVFYKFEFQGRWYCAVTTVEEPIENQILGYGYDEEGNFFTYDIVESLYKEVLNEFTSVHLPEIAGSDDENEAPVLNVAGIGKENGINKKGQALMFFSYGTSDETTHDYALIAYIEPEVKEHRGAFYRYQFLETDDGQKAIATEPIRNDMEYETVKAYFKKEKGEELEKLLREDNIVLVY